MSPKGEELSLSGSQVRVGVRVRPLTSKEIQQGGKSSVSVTPPVVGIGQRRFTYDVAFDSNVSQLELYESVSAPLLKSYVDGYNATVSQKYIFPIPSLRGMQGHRN
jgi:predicted neutral ceramidase superfamily lipid hydrolase